MPAWSPVAAERLQDNILNYAQKDPVTAWRIHDEVIERAELLDLHPDIGRKGLVKDTREFVLTGTPFILVYRADKGQVEIINVLHGAQQWPSQKKQVNN